MLRTYVTAACLSLAVAQSTAAPLMGTAHTVAPWTSVSNRTAFEDEKATEWPEAKDAAALKKAVAKIRSARSEDMEAAGRSEIQLEGAAAAPLILKAIAKERKDEAITRLRSALDLVTTKEHTRLLAESLDHKSAELRVSVMRRLAALGDAGLRERAEKILKSVQEKSADPKKAKKLHEDELDRSAILALSTGSPNALEHCLKLAGSKGWPSWRDILRGASASAKAAGTDVADSLKETLAPSSKPSVATQVAALRLIAYAGHEQHARCVVPSLDDTANHIKVAAVNALRMIIDGDAPLDKLSTFDAIGHANEWKSRL